MNAEALKIPSPSRFLAIVAVTVSIVLGVGAVVVPMILNNANASEVPALRQDVSTNRTDINALKIEVDALQKRRDEDISEQRASRAEFIGRLERIENKLDQMADRNSNVKGWNR